MFKSNLALEYWSAFFDFNKELNFPTLYAIITLVFSSLLLNFIASTNKQLNLPHIPWFGLSAIFLFLAVDEYLSLHERLTIPLRETLGSSGFFYYAWTIPYGIGLIIFIIIYLRFLTNLQKNIAFLFLISGFIFVSGAIGMELVGGRYASMHGESDVIFFIFSTIEELLEMLGIAVFTYTLLTYIVTQYEFVNLTVIDQSQVKG